MKKCFSAALLIGGVAFAQAAFAQETPRPPSTVQNATAPAGGSVDQSTNPAAGRRRVPEKVKGPTPHLPNGTVDLSGIWNGGGPIGDIAQGMPKGEAIPMLPSAEKIFKSRQSKDDPEANCLPTGVPRIAPYPWRIVQTPTHIFFLFEGNIHTYRQIFLDGRKHPDDPDPTWYGHSVGKFDGDSLVVDTIGYNDKFWFDFAGHPHTEQLHTVERFTRQDLGTLVVQTQIIDPGAYSKPFTITFTANLRPKEELMEYICQENQIDSKHLVGFTGLE